MKKLDSSLYLYLTGGLGNQLFQLAAGLFFSNNRKLVLNSDFGVPRLNDFGQVELQSFKLPLDVCVPDSKKAKLFERKLLGFTLRRSLKYTSHKTYLRRDKVLIEFCNLIMSRYFRKRIKLHMNKGVGFCEKNTFHQNEFAIGYFQSYKWVSNQSVRKKMQSICLKSESSKVEYYKNLAIVEKPLAMHIRLGDYKHLSEIGILDYSYYQLALKLLWSPSKYKKIWLFSNEPEVAKDFFQNRNDLDIRWMPIIDLSTAETFEIMRCCKGYIIANSTFSWWAAYLSHTASPEVIAPIPWFKTAPEPVAIIPNEWKRIPGW